jgi:DNA-binding IscR family transcriptional regulator
MSAVLRALEGPIAPMICASEDPAHAGICERMGYCNVNHLWVTVRTAISSALDSITLADLAAPRARHPYHSAPVAIEKPTSIAKPPPIEELTSATPYAQAKD